MQRERRSPVGQSANAVTGIKIASKSVVKSLNGLFDGVTLVHGSNVTITKSGNTLVIAAEVPPSDLASVAHDASLLGDGATLRWASRRATWATRNWRMARPEAAQH